MTYRQSILPLTLWLAATTAAAQGPRTSSAMFMPTPAATSTYVPFSASAVGTRLPIRWGLDVAWLNEQNMRKGINFIGKKHLSIARSSFQMNEPLVGDTELTESQQTMLGNRTKMIDLISPDVDIVLNADQGDGTAQFIHSYYSANNRANTQHWARLIDASVAWMQAHYPRHTIVAVSPFNEPDYTAWNEGSLANFKEIARLLKEEYPRFQNIAITAGNTLNNDQALRWYNGVKPYVTWGNTHQLAGSFDTFAAFWQQVVRDNNHAYADELHNVGEAMIAANYGMTTGIWWAFDSRARGEFCQISNEGTRLAYAENRGDWTAATVYRNANGQMKAFLGGSERQAQTSSYTFVSPEQDVFVDGRGPLRYFHATYPGGNGYQKGQTNAERVYDITHGEDVERKAITAGQYKIMNKATGGLVSTLGTSNIVQHYYTPKTKPKNIDLWQVEPVSDRIGGDYSFYTVTNVENKMHINVLNNSTLPGADLLPYDAGNASNEQWYMEYAGEGFYYIRNRESSLYLTLFRPTKASNVKIVQDTLRTGNDANRQLWRLLPADAPTELTAPAASTGLTATPQLASVKLNWAASTSSDADTYTVLRGNADGTGWNTIARGLATTTFTDNSCRQGSSYIYKVVAVDKSLNASKPTDEVAAAPTAERGMVASWQFEDNTYDETANMMDATTAATVAYQADAKVGEKALALDGANWMQLPYEVADMDNMTIMLWAKWTNSTKTWTRLFDFGNGTSQYMFLTPSNGSTMRFAIKNGGDEQTVDATAKLPANTWHHIAVTIANGKVTLYQDGTVVGSSTGITIKPSDLRTALNYVGKSQWASDPLFAGAIDDLRIYNYELTPDEIRSIIATPTAIGNIEAPNNASQEPEYSINGSKVPASYKGIVVRRGHKTIRR